MDEQGQLKALREFARSIISDHCWGYCPDPDGGEIQEVAEKLGLLVPHIATAEDCDRNADFDVGDTIYKYADWLRERTEKQSDDRTDAGAGAIPIVTQMTEPEADGGTPTPTEEQIEAVKALARGDRASSTALIAALRTLALYPELVEALRFYANKGNYDMGKDNHAPAVLDYGRRARAVLAKVKP